jgi:hypothetical protein
MAGRLRIGQDHRISRIDRIQRRVKGRVGSLAIYPVNPRDPVILSEKPIDSTSEFGAWDASHRNPRLVR